MKSRFRVLLFGAALCGVSRVAVAQTAPETLSAPQIPVGESKKAHQIVIKNVPPSLVAAWIDPKNHPLPLQFQNGATSKSTKNEADVLTLKTGDFNLDDFAKSTKNEASYFALPEGIDRIVPIDPQNALLVFGTEAGFRELTATVKFLDQPLRQVELETHFVQIKPQDLGALAIEDKPDVPSEGLQIRFVRGNFQVKLARLVAQNQAKILAAPRVLATNNFRASVNAFYPLPNTLGTEYRIDVTPTINNDDTLTLLLSTSSQLKMAGKKSEPVPTKTGDLTSIFNVRDGDTAALTGFSPRLLPGLENSKSLAPDTVIFVTARIVRRAADDERPIPGQ